MDTLEAMRCVKAQGLKTIAAGQRAREHAGARGRLPCPHAGRAGDRRRLDQGVHDPARDARLPGGRRGAGARAPLGRARGGADPGAGRGPGAGRRGAAQGRRVRADRARAHPCPRRALSRPRHQLRDRAGGCAEAQGDQLHPRRGLCRRRAQARADRADRRERAGDRGGAARPAVRQDREQPAGGGRARRQGDPLERPARLRRSSRPMSTGRWRCPRSTRSWRRCSTRSRSSCWPTTPPCSRARTSTSRATSRSRSRSSRPPARAGERSPPGNARTAALAARPDATLYSRAPGPAP